MVDKDLNVHYKKDEKILISNIVDKYNQYQKTGKSTCSNFLNSVSLNLVISYLEYKKIPYSIYEPYPFLEKKIIYFGNYEDFVTFYKVKISKNITHSKILGTLFSIGMNENTIGDIIVEDGYFFYTNLTRFNSYLEDNFSFISRELITLEKVSKIELVQEHYKIFTILVSSMRFDTIISKLTSKSRNQVKKLILEKSILLNYKEINNFSINLKENDILSIRKVGKFKIGKSQGLTKKENIILEIFQYM